MGDSSVNIFDGTTKAAHRDRAAYLGGDSDPLLSTVTERLLDRLEDCRRSFAHAAVLGGAAQYVVPALFGGRAGVERITVIDTSKDMLDRVRALEARARTNAEAASSGGSGSDGGGGSGGGGGEVARPWPVVSYVHMEGEVLPVEPGSFDLVVSSLGLHWFNDLPTIIAQCRFALRPDGLMLSALFGGESLQELRISCALAQMERLGGVSPVVSPLAQVRDAGNLLTRAGLAMPTVDLDTFRLRYECPTEVVRHLRSMGESNGVVHRQRVLARDVPLAAAAVYRSMFGEESDGSVPATFQVMYLTGWSPHESQQKPKERGSATMSFQDLAEGLVKEGAVSGSTGEGGEEGGSCGATPQSPPPAAK
ncbi:hypothetical protein FOA52_012296 [Chlamydomonas sp. UWO 241]|nr:hypothetical protein FOA52_012296 [Chlamydomonas sp. UWO 241]